jgi:hypothetical protein
LTIRRCDLSALTFAVALTTLAEHDARKASVVELPFGVERVMADWDEAAIEQRARELAAVACRVWARP